MEFILVVAPHNAEVRLALTPIKTCSGRVSNRCIVITAGRWFHRMVKLASPLHEYDQTSSGTLSAKPDCGSDIQITQWSSLWRQRLTMAVIGRCSCLCSPRLGADALKWCLSSPPASRNHDSRFGDCVLPKIGPEISINSELFPPIIFAIFWSRVKYFDCNKKKTHFHAGLTSVTSCS